MHKSASDSSNSYLAASLRKYNARLMNPKANGHRVDGKGTEVIGVIRTAKSRSGSELSL